MVHGLLLTNLGTPDAPTTRAVRRYLREFLWDRRVIDLNPVARALLLYGVILPFRPKRSAHAYQQIWTPDGSPLLIHGNALARAVQALLGPSWKVVLGMRYGSPSIPTALDSLLGGPEPVSDLLVLPLYPQYASSSSGSTMAKVMTSLADRTVVPDMAFIRDFHLAPGFLDAVVTVAKPALQAFAPDHVLLSFHGLPEHHMRASDVSGQHCLASPTCCDVRVPANDPCYRAQSFRTARALAERLGLAAGAWSIGFQSRLGRRPWVKPYTDQILKALPAQGVKRLAVLTPSFAADCLETLEEIAIRGRRDFIAAGGEDLTLVPCVNAAPSWAEAVAAMARGRSDAAHAFGAP